MTLRADARANLRRYPEHEVLRDALQAGRERFGFRLVHYSIQKDHLHLIVEAVDRRALSRGMQGLGIRMAKAVNRVNGGHGKVFTDRYHARPLRTPMEVRRALNYVLNNYRRHLAKAGHLLSSTWMDPHSSSAYFDGWKRPRPISLPDDAPVVAPSIWLLETGWRRHGPIPLGELPGEI